MTRPGCALEKVTITGGKFLSIGGTFAFGDKDTSFGLSGPGPYERKIFWASQISVILYDVDDRRAWLVDGANALLHMTRAALSQKEFRDNALLDLNKFSYADPDSGEDAAVNALKEIGLKNPILIYETPTFLQSSSAEIKWGVKELVIELWHILEQIQDHQTARSGPGMPLRFTDRDKLEGFGFMDIVSGERTIRPRLAILKPSGRGWVDFARKVEAITLMARGLGELIKPSPTSPPLCPIWEHVPTGQDYLVARIYQLRQICEKIGSINEKSLELVQDLYWHQGGKLFEPCNPRNCSSSCDRIQTILPEKTLGTKRCPRPFHESKGAVVFGRSNRFSRWWPRNPKLAPMDNETACKEEDERGPTTESSTPTFPERILQSEASPNPDHSLGDISGWNAVVQDMVPNETRRDNDNTGLKFVGTEPKYKGVVRNGYPLIHQANLPASNTKPSWSEAFGSGSQTDGDLEDGQQFHMESNVADVSAITDSSALPIRPVGTLPSSNRIRKRKGMGQLRSVILNFV